MSRLLPYETLRNIRDLGGMRTSDGKIIATGRLIRCGHLADLSACDLAKLALLTDTIIDFRTDQERIEKPDAVIPGTTAYHIPILNKLTGGITREEESDRDVIARLATDPAASKNYMCRMYTEFAENDYVVSQFARFIRILLENHEKAVLWHCTAGKDRAGTAAVIIEEILGIPRETIVADYLKTNEYLAPDIEYLISFIKKQTGTEKYTDDTDPHSADQALRYLFSADESFIHSFYSAVQRRFGSFDGFLREGLRLTGNDLQALRLKYLTD